MIQGMPALPHSAHAEEMRTFFRDQVGITRTDTGAGWPIFDGRLA